MRTPDEEIWGDPGGVDPYVHFFPRKLTFLERCWRAITRFIHG